jgi:hypothetical protein
LYDELATMQETLQGYLILVNGEIGKTIRGPAYYLTLEEAEKVAEEWRDSNKDTDPSLTFTVVPATLSVEDGLVYDK